jgi:lysophospholipase L1-like esterase
MDDLIARHPEITFIHTTVPLRYSPNGVGIWIRELMGKANKSKLDNVKRNEFNRLLHSSYAQSPIVDIAASESTYPDGNREAFDMGEQTYYSLIGEYTDDGGHLNEKGRGWVAAAFVRELAQIIRNRAEK